MTWEYALQDSVYHDDEELCSAVLQLLDTWSNMETQRLDVIDVFSKLVHGEVLPTPEQEKYLWIPYTSMLGAYGPKRGEHVRVALDAGLKSKERVPGFVESFRGDEGKVVDVRRGSVFVLLEDYANSSAIAFPSTCLERRVVDGTTQTASAD